MSQSFKIRGESMEIELKADGSGTDRPRAMTLVTGSMGPHITDDGSGASAGMDWFQGKLAAVVYSEDADQPAVMVEFDRRGRVKSVAVRQDLQDKIQSL